MPDGPDYKEYATNMIRIHELIMQSALNNATQNSQSLEAIRALILQQTTELRSDMKAQHGNISGTLSDQNVAITGHVKFFLELLNKHEEKDDAVEKRVTILEETMKRIKWIFGPVVIAFLSAWEAIKKLFLGR